MPAGDRTGPRGAGPKSGRGLGNCSTPQEGIYPKADGTLGQRAGSRRAGKGQGRGRGGRGLGNRNQQ